LWSDLLPAFFRGTWITLQITVESVALALLVAIVTGIARLSRYRIIRAAAAVYVEVFRGTSLLVQLFWLYFALPMFMNVQLSSGAAAVLALTLNYGAYGSEVVRSSILAVPAGQTEAAIALNMTPYQRMRRVIFPQALVRMLPAFGNLQIELLKGTSLVYFITLADLTYEGMILRSYDASSTTEIFVLLLIFYFILAHVLNSAVRWFERRAAAGRS